MCKKCQAAAVDKEDLKRREVSLAYPLSLPSRMLTDFDWQEYVPRSSVALGSSKADLRSRAASKQILGPLSTQAVATPPTRTSKPTPSRPHILTRLQHTACTMWEERE